MGKGKMGGRWGGREVGRGARWEGGGKGGRNVKKGETK